MPKIHANRPDTHELVESTPAAPPADPDPVEAVEHVEAVEEPKPTPRKRNVVRAQAGHAAGSGGAGSLG